MKSKFLTLDWKDFSRGLLIAFLTAVLTGVINILDTGAVFTWVTMKPVLIVSGVGLLVLAMLLFVGWQFRRWSRSAPVELRRLAKRVRDKALRADPILSGPLAPALDSMIKAIESSKVDPVSEEGQRIVKVLRRVDATLDEKAAENKACDERKMADELVSEVEIALEAAGEAARLGPQR